MLYSKVALYISFCLMVATLCGCGGPRPIVIGLDSNKPADLPSTKMWEYEFKGALQSIYFTPNSILTTITAPQQQGALPVKSYFSPEEGNLIWQGSLNEGLLIADTPFPILLTISEDKRLNLACYSYSGDEIRWQVEPKGTLLYSSSDKTQNILLVLTTHSSQLKSKSQEAVLTSYSLETGNEIFSTVLTGVDQNLYTPDDILFCSKDVLYFCYGGITLAMSSQTGKVLWNHKANIPKEDQLLPVNYWEECPDGVMLVSGRHVFSLSERQGLLWHVKLPERIFPRSISYDESGLLMSYWLPDGAGILKLDVDNGHVVWHNEQIASSKEIWSPKGFVSTLDSIIYSANRKLISLDKHDGTEKYARKLDIPYKEYSDYKLLLKRDSNLILLGARNVQSYKPETGKLEWGIKGFETPYATWDRYMAYSSQFKTAAYSGASQFSGGQPIGSTPTGIRGVYRYEVRRVNPEANINVPVITRKRTITDLLESIPVNSIGAEHSSLNRVGIGSAAKPGLGRSGMIPGRYSSFVNSLQKVVAVNFQANVAVVDLNNGRMFNYPLLPSVQCSPFAVTDSAIKWMVEIYEPVGLFCNSRKIDFFKIKAPGTVANRDN